MKQLVQESTSGVFILTDVPSPVLRPGSVLIQVTHSLVSTGTERGRVQSSTPSFAAHVEKLQRKLVKAQRIIEEGGAPALVEKLRRRFGIPTERTLSPTGYSATGRVIAVAPDVYGISPGDHVACAGVGYANHAEIVCVPQNLCARVPEGVNLEDAAFGTVGAIALHGIRQADCRLGDTIVVIGLGLIGLLAVQIARAAGCQVIGIDVRQERCDRAIELGADAAFVRDVPDLAQRVQSFAPHGADCVVICAATNSNDPIELAGNLCRERGTVVALGAIGLQVPREIYYRKELQLLQSRSYGPGRYDPAYEEYGNDYPIGYVRWTEQRNIAAFLDLIRKRSVKASGLVTHRFPFERAPEAYELLAKDSSVLAILLEYAAQPSAVRPRAIHFTKPMDGVLTIGIIGTGSFARSVLIPAILKHDGVSIYAVASANGLSAKSVAEKYQIPMIASDAGQVVQDSATRAIVIATRHDTHADLVISAIEAGKPVFVEKPLAITCEQLDQIEQAYLEDNAPSVMVGFNRRFAPLVQKIREFFSQVNEPKFILYRVNAGFIAREHWLQQATIGGGRLVGEACHFVDLICYLIGQPVGGIDAQMMNDVGRYAGDNFVISLRFTDGSLGNLIYVANGNSQLPKEYIEMHSGGCTGVLDDFTRLSLHSGQKTQVIKSKRDKGHSAEIAAWLDCLRHGTREPNPFVESVATMRAVFAAQTILALPTLM